MYKSPQKDNNNEADLSYSHIFNSKPCWKDVKLTNSNIKYYWPKYFSARAMSSNSLISYSEIFYHSSNNVH